MTEARVGLGFDSHAREEGRTLRLAGLEFDGEPGLAGHSDGDVVCHAIADALLGAAALGDIGQHFPEDDPATAGIAGEDLLGRTVELLRGSGFAPLGSDVVVIAERPSLGQRREEMRGSLARMLGLAAERVSVKATRPEGLGLTGDGIGCLAVVTISPS